MPTQINSNNTPKTYNAGDLVDAYSLAECDMQWMSVAITDIKKRLKEIKRELGNKGVIGFYDLEHVVDMYQYIAENRLSHYSDETEAYQVELEANKKAVTL
ncbi:hypothetical protein [Acinetobacter sp. CWB-B33]|uniref:hypothetical protein n=1 Tax=Acinetobacter sp. CWB-B33 TaxID=2815724 RepID=UPI0031FE935F